MDDRAGGDCAAAGVSRTDAGRDVVSLDVNGRVHALKLPRSTPLLTVLRNDLELNGPKFGCGLGECGACAVLIDGESIRACVLTVGHVVGSRIVTLEGLGTLERPHPIQQAFIKAQAAQCGYCLNGMIIATKSLLDRNPEPTDAQIRDALRYHLCRCGTHVEILAAVGVAAKLLAAERGSSR
jgi:nicotinate dehydrogenase subunit A